MFNKKPRDPRGKHTYGYGSCGRCGTTWNHFDHDEKVSIPTGGGRGTFALDVYCWNESTVETRLMYFLSAFDQHHHGDNIARLRLIHAIRTYDPNESYWHFVDRVEREVPATFDELVASLHQEIVNQ